MRRIEEVRLEELKKEWKRSVNVRKSGIGKFLYEAYRPCMYLCVNGEVRFMSGNSKRGFSDALFVIPLDDLQEEMNDWWLEDTAELTEEQKEEMYQEWFNEDLDDVVIERIEKLIDEVKIDVWGGEYYE